jgi:chorismate dehydratase
VDVEHSPYAIFDLGEEWTGATGLPMVFAVWGGRRDCVTPEISARFLESCRFGLAHMEDIVRLEAAPRGLSQELVREYFARNVALEFGEQERRGLELFLRYAAESAMLEPTGKPRA